MDIDTTSVEHRRRVLFERAESAETDAINSYNATVAESMRNHLVVSEEVALLRAIFQMLRSMECRMRLIHLHFDETAVDDDH